MLNKSKKQIDQLYETSPKHKYKNIDISLRNQLIRMVNQQKKSIYRAAKDLSINHSTAKAILKKFRKFGTVFTRKSERACLLQAEDQNVNGNQYSNSNEVQAREEEPELQIGFGNTAANQHIIGFEPSQNMFYYSWPLIFGLFYGFP